MVIGADGYPRAGNGELLKPDVSITRVDNYSWRSQDHETPKLLMITQRTLIVIERESSVTLLLSRSLF